MTGPRTVAIVPAFNEAASVGRVVEEIRAFDEAIDVVVVDDASTDGTGDVARRAGATVVVIPFNVGIGGAVQTGFMYALERGYERALRLDGDGQHVAAELSKLLAPLDRGEADVVVGSRFAAASATYRPPLLRRLGIRLFAWLVSVLGGQRVTDTTSGFQAIDRAGIELFAERYPHDYPEVEATLVALRSGLRLLQVPVEMRERETGSSSITVLRSAYYMVKVSLAVLIASLRRYPRTEAGP
jgi:glycosyltransferase involved in cell wall biosynthesis